LEKSGGRGGAYKSRDARGATYAVASARSGGVLCGRERSGSISGASQDFDLLRYGLTPRVGWVLHFSVRQTVSRGIGVEETNRGHLHASSSEMYVGGVVRRRSLDG
jgi:hypothetical protein